RPFQTGRPAARSKPAPFVTPLQSEQCRPSSPGRYVQTAPASPPASWVHPARPDGCQPAPANHNNARSLPPQAALVPRSHPKPHNAPQPSNWPHTAWENAEPATRTKLPPLADTASGPTLLPDTPHFAAGGLANPPQAIHSKPDRPALASPADEKAHQKRTPRTLGLYSADTPPVHGRLAPPSQDSINPAASPHWPPARMLKEHAPNVAALYLGPSCHAASRYRHPPSATDHPGFVARIP